MYETHLSKYCERKIGCSAICRVRESLHHVDPNGVIPTNSPKTISCFRLGLRNIFEESLGTTIKEIAIGTNTSLQPLPANFPAATVLRYFLAACDKWQSPSRTRSDRGVENVEIERYMLQT